MRADCCEYGKEIVFCDISGKFLQQLCYCQLLRPGRGLTTPPYSAEVKGRVELYFYSHSGPSWPDVGRTTSEVLGELVSCSCNAAFAGRE